MSRKPRKLFPEIRRMIKDEYGTVEAFANEVLGVHRVVLQYKLSGKYPFTLVEVAKIQKAFNLTDEETVRFFLHSDERRANE